MEDAAKRGIQILTITSPAYPIHLRRISDRPLLLYVRGTLNDQARSVACIGTRQPTRFGEEVTRRIVKLLCENRWSIVSGLAIGVDTIAHAAALESSGHTVAILANGLDTIYPKSNAKLAEQILEAGGALVSEQPVGTPVMGRNLVLRDRLQSGMSVATVVMQTDIVGGSMHTVRFTLQQQRLLVAPVPTGEHATEGKSQGILALTQKTGSELAELVHAEHEYLDLLRTRFRDRPTALALRDKRAYDGLLTCLNDAVANAAVKSDGQLPLRLPS
jgi:DNA processing protein